MQQETAALVRRYLASGLMLILTGGLTFPALAQMGSVRIEEIHALPKEGENLGSVELRLETPQPAKLPRAADELVFNVRNIVITGVTVYSPDTMRALYKPLLGRQVKLSDLTALTEKIEARYRKDGYLLCKAVVPTQNVADGVYTINVTEGYIAEVSVEGRSPTLRNQVQKIMDRVTGASPLKLAMLERTLMDANEIPGARISALLRPSQTEPNATELVVSVDAPRISAGVSVDNAGGKNTGIWTTGANLGMRSPFKDGGHFTLGFASTPDLTRRRMVDGKYAAELRNRGWVFSLTGMAAHGEPAGTVKSLDIVSNSEAFGPHLSIPLYLDRNQRLVAEGGLTFNRAEMTMTGGGLSNEDWRVGDIGLVYQHKALKSGTLDASIVLSRGFSVYGGTHKGNASLSRTDADPLATKEVISLKRVQRVTGPVSIMAQAQYQHAHSPLMTGEEVHFGGSGIGRGYDPAALSGDDGIGGSFEVRYDFYAPFQKVDSVQLFAFTDNARVFTRNQPDSGHQDRISSIGLGARSVIAEKLSLSLELDRTLIPTPGSNDGKRDTRVIMYAGARY